VTANTIVIQLGSENWLLGGCQGAGCSEAPPDKRITISADWREYRIPLAIWVILFALIADISFGVGVAALAGAVSWALLAKAHSREPTSASRWSIVPTAHGGYASFSTSF
jgi:hypothetical protein